MVGDNGSGKSTLLRIMAGLDQDFQGTAKPAKNVRVGYVQQEPQLDADKTVRENLEMAFSETTGMLKEYDDLSIAMGEMAEDEMDRAMERMGSLQGKINAVDGWDFRPHPGNGRG